MVCLVKLDLKNILASACPFPIYSRKYLISLQWELVQPFRYMHSYCLIRMMVEYKQPHIFECIVIKELNFWKDWKDWEVPAFWGGSVSLRSQKLPIFSKVLQLFIPAINKRCPMFCLAPYNSLISLPYQLH